MVGFSALVDGSWGSSDLPTDYSRHLPHSDFVMGNVMLFQLHQPGRFSALSVMVLVIHSALLLFSVILLSTLHLGIRIQGPWLILFGFYLGSLAMRSVVQIGLTAYRWKHHHLWTNQPDNEDSDSDLKTSLRWFRMIHWMLRGIQLLFISVAFTGLILVLSADSSLDSTSLAPTLIVLADLLTLVFPYCVMLALLSLFNWDQLSSLLPYLPVSESSIKYWEAYHRRLSEWSRQHPDEGLTGAEIRSLSSTRYSVLSAAKGDPDLCVICFSPFVIGEKIRVLPCKHQYHQRCIDVWLNKRGVCCLCLRRIGNHDRATENRGTFADTESPSQQSSVQITLISNTENSWTGVDSVCLPSIPGDLLDLALVSKKNVEHELSRIR